jgi:hypothetical protein
MMRWIDFFHSVILLKARRRETHIRTRVRQRMATRWIDGLDKSLSMPLFTSSLPVPLECLLSTVGLWFGMPCTALFLGPLLIASAADPPLFFRAALPALALVSTWWLFVVTQSKRDSDAGRTSPGFAISDLPTGGGRGFHRACKEGGYAHVKCEIDLSS